MFEVLSYSTQRGDLIQAIRIKLDKSRRPSHHQDIKSANKHQTSITIQQA